ncbi:MAG: C25 family cysteine peptidase, partial [Chloroflexota bacterium]
MRYFILFTFITFFLVFTSSPSFSLNEPEPQITSFSDRIELSWQTPTLSWLEDERGHLLAQVEGYELTKIPESYRVPFYSALIAIPEGASPTMQITAVSEKDILIDGALDIAPRPEGVVIDDAGNVAGGDFVEVSAAIHQDLPLVDFHEIGSMRGTRLARVTFYPLHPQLNGTARWIDSISIAVEFNLPISSYSARAPISDPLTSSLVSMVVNPQHIQPPSRDSDTVGNKTAFIQNQQSNQEVVIEVAETGLTAVTYSDLTNAGFSLSGVDPDLLHLQLNGSSIPFEWDGDDDTQFESNEQIIFYAAPEFSRWSNSDAYILSVESTNGSRIATSAPSITGLQTGDRTTSLLLEENNIYGPNCYCGKLPFGRDGDRFVWDDLRQPGRPENDYAFSLPLADSSKGAELTVWYIGFTSINSQNPDHKMIVSINDTQLGNTTWDARTAVTDTFPIPIATLQTENELNLQIPEVSGVTIDGIWFDAASISYVLNSNSVGNQISFLGEATNHKYTTEMTNVSNVRVYDITNPNAPVKITNLNTSGNSVTFGEATAGQHAYALSNGNGLISPETVRLKYSLRTEGETSVDYVILSHPDFISSLTRLVNWREAQGLEVVVEDVLAIYDEYGNGRPSPDAIYDYLSDAYANWTPTYVLFVGDATVDPKQYLDNSSGTWMLPYMADVDPWIGEVPADNRYVSVDGNDIVPDMLTGRLPVNSAQETAVVVNKIVDYEENPAFGLWNGYVSLVADDRDSAGDFEDHSEEIIDLHLQNP